MKSFYKKYISTLFATRRLYILLAALAALFVLRFFIVWLGILPYLFFILFCIALLIDYFLLYNKEKGIFARRLLAERLSNGDENAVTISIESFYAIPVYLEVIDEIPHQLQRRDVLFKLTLQPGEAKNIRYNLRPVKRGSYDFGDILIYVAAAMGFLNRRYSMGQAVNVPVYPSYLQLRKYQLIATAIRLNEAGIKKIRRLGHSMEFEQIKEYVPGDDYRTINWKATARKGGLMINNYTDEKSQQVYCVIDKSRVMKMPFNRLTLLDYAINASLVLCNVALTKGDRAGLLTFAETISSFLAADKKASQMQAILETLYNQKTRYLESDFEKLYITIRRKITQRSLLVLFTNFESLTGMRRQLSYLKKIAENHLLLVVLFENTEITSFINQPAENTEQVYTKTVAENFVYEKRLIVKELKQAGILAILTPPEQVTVNALNKYLEIKARHMI
ncbi:MAG: DUF58 domain-containing protein [Parafilimonas sp.]